MRDIRESTPAVRRLLVPFLVLAGLGAIQLYVFPDDTDRFFAWTLAPQPSATFMGAGFAAGLVLTALSYRTRIWAVARSATFTIFVFATAMTAATFLHLDKLHFGSDLLTARIAAWLWFAVYVVVTPLLGLLIWSQVKAPGVDAPRRHVLSPVLRGVLLAMGMGFVGLAGWLFVSPTSAAEVWPWAITPFAARAIAAWLVAIGWAALQAVVENDTDRVRPAAATFAALGILLLGGLVRGSSHFDWGGPASWSYLTVVVASVAVGVAGFARGRQAVVPDHADIGEASLAS